MVKKQNTVIQFEGNVPVHLTLDTDPKTAKGKKVTTEWGEKEFFTYFCDNERVFFASEALNGKLGGYSKGDSLVITKVQDANRTIWTVNAAGATQPASQGVASKAEILPIILSEILEIKELVKTLTSTKNETTKKDFPKNETDLGF